MVFLKAWEERPEWLLNPASPNGGKSRAMVSAGGRAAAPQQTSRVRFAALSLAPEAVRSRSQGNGESCEDDEDDEGDASVSFGQLLLHPVAFMHFVPDEAALFFAGAFSGVTAKSLTAPLDRIKILMQVYGAKVAQESAKKKIGLLEAVVKIAKDEGLKGFWKGNLPQIIRIVPYSAVQLFAYEIYKKLFKGKNIEPSVLGRLAAGGCAGMTSTLVTYPLDVLRLRLAVDSTQLTMGQLAMDMLRHEGIGAFYKGLGPSLIGIAPYIAINFCVFDLVKKGLPEDFRKSPQASFITAMASATCATLLCYPLDTIRRQLQLRGSPFTNVLEAFPGIIERDGVAGLYRGFVPNALKNLPNSSVRLTTFDAAKNLIDVGEAEYQRLLKKNRKKSRKKT